MAMPDDKNIHAGHRQRMMTRFGINGFDGWQDHETVEVLLYRIRPRINTNVIAHRLINAFGSLGNLLEADQNEIAKIDGIGEKSAEFIASSRSRVSDMIREQYRGLSDLNIYQLAFLADWYMRDRENPVGMILYDIDGCFEDFVCLPYVKKVDTIDAEVMFRDFGIELKNHTFSLFVRTQHELTKEDIFEIRRYTFARSIILDEVFLLNGREPIPTIHTDHPPRYVD